MEVTVFSADGEFEREGRGEKEGLPVALFPFVTEEEKEADREGRGEAEEDSVDETLGHGDGEEVAPPPMLLLAVTDRL